MRQGLNRRRGLRAAFASSARLRVLAVVLLAALACVSCSTFVPPVRTAERTVLLLPAFFAQSPVDPSAWLAPPIDQSEMRLGAGERGAILHIYRPRGGRHPALIVSLGVAPAAPDDPAVVHLMRGLARSGFVAVLVQSPNLDAGHLEPEAPELLVSAFQTIAMQSFVDPRRIGLIGFSVGGSLALIAAADPKISSQVRVVEAFGAYDRLTSVMRATVTRTFEIDGRTEAWQPDSLAVVSVRRNLIELLTTPDDRVILDATFDADGPAPTQAPAGLSSQGIEVFRLLTASDPVQWDALFALISTEARDSLDKLSPQDYLGRVRAPVYLMVDQGDPLIPFVESREIQATLRKAGHPAYFSQFAIFRHVEPTRAVSVVVLMRDLLRLFAHVNSVLERF
jgi:acetyl esterase/lipase